MTQGEFNVLLGLFDVLISLGILATFVVLFVRGDIAPVSILERLVPEIVDVVFDKLREKGVI